MQKYKKDFVYLTFSRVFFATACIADFHVSFASQCSSKYIGVREIRKSVRREDPNATQEK